jgi:hypothetical protein
MAADVRSLLPRDKFDVDAVRAIADTGYPAIAPILDDLLDWTADGNWPVARPLADFLVTVGEPLAAPLSRLLRGDGTPKGHCLGDGSHKEHCLRLLTRKLPIDVLSKIEDDLRLLAEQPSKDDRQCEADVAARDALSRLRDLRAMEG